MGRGASRRVVFVTITFHPEPGAMRGLPLAKALRNAHGWDVEVITAIPWYPLGRFYDGYPARSYHREVVDGIPVHRVWLYPSHDRSATRRIITYVSFMISLLLFGIWRVRRAPVIYHVDNLPTTGLVVAVLRWLWKARVVQHIGDLWPDTVLASGMVRGVSRRVIAGVLHRFMRGIYATNDCITVITEGFQRTLTSRGVAPEKVVVLPNWADEDRLRPVPVEAGLRVTLGLDHRFLVLYAGNLGPLQALGVILDAAERLRDAPVQFVIVGDGSERQHLMAEAARRGLAEQVRFLPARPVEDIPMLNAIGDALLVHLKDEPFLHATVPSKTQVSLLAGRPILMGCRGDAARIVEEAGAGICFTPDDGDALATAVRQMAAMDIDARAAMGARGAAYYASRLSLKTGAQVMHTLFANLLPDARPDHGRADRHDAADPAPARETAS